MPVLKKALIFKRKFLTISILIILALVVYLNRSYAHIFDYDKDRQIVSMNIQRNYSIKGSGKEAAIKYIALGDSLTYGFGASDYKGTFPYLLAEKLAQKHELVEVHNLGVSGAVIGELAETQLPQALKEKPDFVTVMIGTNDVHDFEKLQEFKKSLVYIIDSLQTGTNAKILLINIPYLGTKDLILPPYDTVMDLRIRDFNRVIEQTAEEKQIKYFDLYSASNASFKQNPDKYYSIDKFHPSDAGYILWGNLINAD